MDGGNEVELMAGRRLRLPSGRDDMDDTDGHVTNLRVNQRIESLH